MISDRSSGCNCNVIRSRLHYHLIRSSSTSSPCVLYHDFRSVLCLLPVCTASVLVTSPVLFDSCTSSLGVGHLNQAGRLSIQSGLHIQSAQLTICSSVAPEVVYQKPALHHVQRSVMSGCSVICSAV